ncbi:MAG: PEP-CTERM sorting domain-containing protein, partial [Planctomycetota bacterium]|nr:PEP-CTERM sorting domain-containing protein [Planctomycetota bacterium]
DLLVRSLDSTADTVHVLLDVGAALDESAVLAMLSGGNKAEMIDRDLFKKYFAGLTHGNHAMTVVAFEMTGNVGIQRFGGVWTDTIFGRGLGDLTFDGLFSPDDISAFETLYWSENLSFHAAGDVNGDGWITGADAYALEDVLTAGGADAATMEAYDTFIATIPEPATLALLAAGALLLSARRRRTPR